MKLKLSEKEREFFKKQGSRGGKIGGKLSAANMTPEERIARAKKAVAAREAKRKAKVTKKSGRAQ